MNKLLNLNRVCLGPWLKICSQNWLFLSSNKLPRKSWSELFSAKNVAENNIPSIP